MGFPSDAFSTLLHISRPKLDGGRCQTDIHLTWDILDTRQNTDKEIKENTGLKVIHGIHSVKNSRQGVIEQL